MDLFVVLLYAVAAVIWALASFNILRHELHMFQQSGYRPVRYARRISAKPADLLPYLALILLSGIGRWMYDTPWRYLGVAVFGIGAVIAGVAKEPKQAKKPLVWTARAKRLFVTSAILLVATAVLCAVLMPRYFEEPWNGKVFCIVGCVSALMPIVLCIACAINAPMEHRINQGYINDAKRILAGMPNLTVVGVTGSYGKTSVKNYLAALLGAKYMTLATPESYNTTLGAVRTIREYLKPTHEVFICEMGARQVGDIREICELVHPRHGIITAVGEQHLETFGSRENIRKTKYELADAIPADGKLFVNGDSDGIAAEPPKHAHSTYGLEKERDFRGEVLSVSRKGTEFRVTTPSGESATFVTPLIGAHNVQNLVGAIACAYSLGVPLEDMRRPLMRMKAVEHRMQLIERGPVTIIDDAYNSNPAGAHAALETLGLFDIKRVLVTPGMVELGAREAELNREFGADAAAHCDAVALVGEAQTRPIYEGLVGAGFDKENIFVADTLQDAMKWVYSLGGEKVILLENDLPDNY